MTLFIQTPKRSFSVSDIYVMTLVFCIFFAVGRITKAVVEKLREKNKNKDIEIEIPDPRGGVIGTEFSDDSELALMMLSCIVDNERYLIKDPDVIKLIFRLVKEKIKNESLVLTPNMMRFLAFKLLNNNQSLITKIGNVVISSNNRARLLTRAFETAILGLFSSLVLTFLYGLILMIIYFDLTENCVW